MTVGHVDWLREAIVADKPFVAATQGLTSGVELFPFFNEPALKYQSYQVQVQFLNGAPSATNYANLIIRFYDGNGRATANVLWEDEFEINPGAILTWITDRMHGADMSLTATFPGGTVTVNWQMSNRPADRLQVTQGPQGRDRILLSADQVNVGAGLTSAFRFVPLFNGPGEIYIRADATSTYVAEFYTGSLTTILFRLSGGAGADSFRDIVLPLRPLRYRITNNGAGATNFFTSVWGRDN